MSQTEDDPVQETTRHVGAVLRGAAVGAVELSQVRARRQVYVAHHQSAQLRADAERSRAQLAAARAAAVSDKQASRLGPPAGSLIPPAPAPTSLGTLGRPPSWPRREVGCAPEPRSRAGGG